MITNVKPNYMSLFIFLFLSLELNARFLPQDEVISSNFHQLNQEVPQEYKQIEALLLDEFKDDIKSIGAELVVRYQMSSSNINAYAIREGNLWVIKFQGGMITHPKFNAGVYVTVLCHELGHHLGGAPYKAPKHPERYWTSAEGQADYFASNVCLKRFLAKTVGDKIPTQVSGLIQTACKNNYSLAQDYILCLQNAKIAEATGDFLYHLGQTRRGKKYRRPSIATPETNQAIITKLDHAKPQCRVDTLFQGALCNIENFYPFQIYMNCPDEIVPPLSGARPRCWYVPEN